MLIYRDIAPYQLKKMSTQPEEARLLKEILQELHSIHDLLAGFQEALRSSNTSHESSSLDATSIDILSLKPGTLRTWKALKKLGQATCTQIADETGRSFRLESRYLNELYRSGLARKKRRPSEGGGTEMVYWLDGEEEQ